jgi:hypothetical protein
MNSSSLSLKKAQPVHAIATSQLLQAAANNQSVSKMVTPKKDTTWRNVLLGTSGVVVMGAITATKLYFWNKSRIKD